MNFKTILLNIVLIFALAASLATSLNPHGEAQAKAAVVSVSVIPNRAWTWGDNGWGQLGNGTITNSTTPIVPKSLGSVTAVAGGETHSLALASDGTVWAWGDNQFGQLGDGTTNGSTFPVQVKDLSSVVDIAAGRWYSVALKSDGTVWAWGNNWYGQLGNNTCENSNTPVEAWGLSGVTTIDGGGEHVMALKADGTVWAWGDNYYGQLGNGTNVSYCFPEQVDGLNLVTAIATGYYHSLAIKIDGSTWAWGANSYGQLGDATTTNRYLPVRVQGLNSPAEIGGGFYHSLARESDGTVWAWGYNYYGQLGDGTTTNRNLPVQVLGLSGTTNVEGGYYHNLALKSDGTIWAWGFNNDGQLGDGTTTDRKTPVLVNNLSGVVAVAGGGMHSLALRPDQAPLAVDKSVTTAEDNPVQIIISVTDPENDNVTINVTSLPGHGALSGTAPTFTYTPANNFYGSDSFSYQACDPFNICDSAVVSILITPLNDPPTAQDLILTTDEDKPIIFTLNISDAENDPLSTTITASPSHGNLSGTAPNLTYTPALNFNGNDNFTYKICDPYQACDTASVSITINPINDPPIAQDQSITTNEDTAINFTLLASDVDQNPLNITITSPPNHGTLNGTPPILTYIPTMDFYGSDSITYKTCDPSFACDMAIVSITVSPVNDSPFAQDQVISTIQNRPIHFTLTASDPENDPITYTIVSFPWHGNLSGTAPNLTYSPWTNFAGTDNFTYKACDLSNACDSAIVSITVNLNNPPEATDQDITAYQNMPARFTLTTTDADNDLLTYTILDGPDHGSLSETAPQLTYNPTLNYLGSDYFSYQACDLSNACDTAYVWITVVENYSYLPVVYRPRVCIYGRVTEDALPAAGVKVEFWRYDDNSSETELINSQYTDNQGYYCFKGATSLGVGQEYWVDFTNYTSNPNRLALWQTRSITSYTYGSAANLGSFEISNVNLIGPTDRSSVHLPVLFQWNVRPAGPQDSYRLELYEPVALEPWFDTTLLGHSGSYTLTSLPPGFQYGGEYEWYVEILSPDGGSGSSFANNRITFTKP